MKNKLICSSFFLILFYGGCGLNKKDSTHNPYRFPVKETIIKLPSPSYDGLVSVEEALLKRRSVRDYSQDPISLKTLSQLLWAAQGVTSQGGKRTAPSAGSLYPLELYVAAWHVDSLPAGVYHYIPGNHSLEQILTGDIRKDLALAVHQGTPKEGAAALIITGVYHRTTWRFREKGRQYVHMEAGHAAQNVCLQAVSLNIGTVTMGSFNDSLLKKTLFLPEKNEPLYVMPIGKNK